jgi:serine/threonine protein kinase
VKGENLKDFVKKGGFKKYSLKEKRKQILEMFRGIVDGVRFIHRAGIIHSDIKHVNVVVQENTMNPFVIDLGSGIEANNLVEG